MDLYQIVFQQLFQMKWSGHVLVNNSFIFPLFIVGWKNVYNN